MPRTANDTTEVATIARWIAGVALALLLWKTASIVLLLFAGILLAVFLHSAATWLAGLTGLSDGWALAAVGLLILLVLLTTGAVLAPEISAQLDQLTDRIPRAWSDLLAKATRYEWGRRLITSPPNPSDSVALVSNAGVILAATLGSVAHFVVFLLFGLFLAVDPAPYVAGALWLVPRSRRDDTKRIFTHVGKMLRAWLLSRMLAMSIVGVLTTIGLWAIGVQLALTLGLAAGVMTFVPYIGAFASAAPALLLGFVQSPALAGYVVVLYIAIHVLEGYLVTPLIEQEAIRLPPAVSIAAQVILGTALGPLGLILASPLTASAIIVVESLSAEQEPAKAGVTRPSNSATGGGVRLLE